MKLTREEADREADIVYKIYDCYYYLYHHAGDEKLQEKIANLGREHIFLKFQEMRYASELTYQTMKQELEEKLKKLKDEEKK